MFISSRINSRFYLVGRVRLELFYIIGDISDFSDQNGIVEFKNLKVTATTSKYFYLYAICENSAIKLWS